MPVVLKYGVIEVKHVIDNILQTAQSLVEGPNGVATRRLPKKKLSREEQFQMNRKAVITYLASHPGIRNEDFKLKDVGGMTKHQLKHVLKTLKSEKLVSTTGGGRHTRYTLKPKTAPKTNGVNKEAVSAS